jgi:GAF domain-containing protein
VLVPGFDDKLSTRLATEAHEAGETVEDFVARAVAFRLVQSLAARRAPTYRDAVDELVHAGLLPEDPSQPHRESVINDPNRLRILNDTGLLRSEPSDAMYRTVALAAEALSAPSAAVSVVDQNRQCFICAVGFSEGMGDSREVTLDRSLTKYIVASGRPLVINNAKTDPALINNPLVAEGTVAAYLGVPLTSADGFTVGALCVWDNKPRSWSDGHVETLRDLAGVLHAHVFG